ncbi:MAG: glycosyltransferase family 2 protein [Pyrinomonadaceae bacterium]
MSILFYLFAALLVYLSARSLLGGVAYFRFFQAELERQPVDHHPFATMIAPCKGLDKGLAENLTSLFEQVYPEFEIVFVVDDGTDPAVSTINEVIAHCSGHGANGRLVIAPKASGSSQKVENLREAVLHADERSEVFVFVDSDARPNRNWLGHLVAPLEEGSVGATTGYRWFISEKMTFASELRSAWNASIASALGANTKTNFCWGGATAIRREVFDRLDMRERWSGTLSDDFTVTRVIKRAGLEIRFVPGALTPSPGECGLREAIEFTTRQMQITRVYAAHLWLLSYFGSALFTFVMVSAFLIVLLSPQVDYLVWSAIATFLLVTFLSIGKSFLRLKAVRMVIPSASKQALTQMTYWLLTPPLFLYTCIYAMVSRRMTWRGIRYVLVSSERTLRLSDTENSSLAD